MNHWADRRLYGEPDRGFVPVRSQAPITGEVPRYFPAKHEITSSNTGKLILLWLICERHATTPTRARLRYMDSLVIPTDLPPFVRCSHDSEPVDAIIEHCICYGLAWPRRLAAATGTASRLPHHCELQRLTLYPTPILQQSRSYDRIRDFVKSWTFSSWERF
jgi:hypothetical protein